MCSRASFTSDARYVPLLRGLVEVGLSFSGLRALASLGLAAAWVFPGITAVQMEC